MTSGMTKRTERAINTARHLDSLLHLLIEANPERAIEIIRKIRESQKAKAA
jgi:hypothetical protein